MKKLMFGLAVAAISSAFAVESANVVGYMETDLEDKADNPSSTFGAAFVPVTGDVVDLSDLKVSGYTGSVAGGVEAQTLDEYGDSDRLFQWLDGTVGKITLYGWYEDGDAGSLHDDMDEDDRVRIQPGSGLCIFVDDPSMKIQSAGQVPQTDVSVEMVADEGILVVNPTPVDVDLSDTRIAGYTGSVAGGVELQTLDEYGDSDRIFQWLDGTVGKITLYGWYEDGDAGSLHDDFDDEDKVIFKPGQGAMMFIENQDYEFVWPRVTL